TKSARHAVRLEHGRDGFVTNGSQRFERGADLAGQVGVVLVDVDASPLTEQFEAPWDAGETSETRGDVGGGDVEFEREDRDDGGVGDVVGARDGQYQLEVTVGTSQL